MKRIKLSLLLLILGCTVQAQLQWPATTQTSKPWTRWWWMGSAVDAANIKSLLKEYSSAGIGGVEIVPIYGAKGYESKYIPYLSQQWMDMLDTTVQSANRLHMGVDVAVGTGWPIGGPQVSLTDAATKLQIQRYTITAGQAFQDKIIINDPKLQNLEGIGLSALMAYNADGEILDLTNKVSTDGTLEWIPEKGNWELYAVFNSKTFQKVKRAAPGGEGYTFDHFSKNALADYLKKFDTAYGNTAHGVRSFFNDSYEVFGANWSPDFFNEFKKRRGYDLKNYLREFCSDDSTDMVARIKSDYRETMSDLMLDNFSRKFSSWSHSKNALSTNQAHGSPGNILDLYAAVDIAETETFGSSYFPIPGLRRDSADIRNVDPDPVMQQFASSASHVMGHNLTSSESFTWLSEHFKTSWAQCKPEVEQLFLSGINHVFFHGTTYSPKDAAWPGWLFYASVNVVPSNSLWPQLNGLTEYITRCQSVLQEGKPDNELAIYWPVYDVWNDVKGTNKTFTMHSVDEWLHGKSFYKNVKLLQQQGYTSDFISDKMITAAYVNNREIQVTAKGSSYKAIIVPQCELIPLSTLQKLKQLAEAGATVILEKLPSNIPGYYDIEERKKQFKEFTASLHFNDISKTVQEYRIGKGRMLLSTDIVGALKYASVNPEELSSIGLKFIRRKTTTGKFYYIVNHTAKDIDTLICLQTMAKSIVLLDPQSGDQGLVKLLIRNGKQYIRIQLQSGEALIVKTSNSIPSLRNWKYRGIKQMPITINSKWQVQFVSGGPVFPAKRTIEQLSSWTTWGDTTVENFSGTAVYTTSFNLAIKSDADYYLQLGRVCEAAKVWINGKFVGIAWSNPYQLKAGVYLKQGKNDIRIEVSNLMANRIRYMDRNKISWRNYHEINFVNINYKNFDASGWELQPSGLLGPVILQPVEVIK